MSGDNSIYSGGTLVPVSDGSLVEVRGRLFNGADGNFYARPRLHPGEPDTDLREQAQLDSTMNRIRIAGFEAPEHHLALPERPWHIVRGTLNGLTIEADAVLDRPDEWHDIWEDPSPTGPGSNPDAPSKWFLSPDREAFLAEILAEIRDSKDFYPCISSGLSGTYDGTFRVSVFMLAINERFASWAGKFSHDDLVVRSFVMAQPVNPQ